MEQHRAFAASIFQNSTQAAEGSSNVGEMQNSVLVEILSRMGDLDHFQDHQSACIGGSGHMIELASNGIQHITHPQSSGTHELSQELIVELPTTEISQQASCSKRGRPGRPKVRPAKDRQAWHYHLGGVRHCRVPITPEIREALEVAYISRIMSKNFRKEGQPEKERLAQVTGMEIDKIQEWFKNRRKKDKLISERQQGKKQLKGHRGRRSNSNGSIGSSQGITADEGSVVGQDPLLDPAETVTVVSSSDQNPAVQEEVILT